MKLKFNVGDRVFDKKYGHGVVQRVDAGNSEFPYLKCATYYTERENGLAQCWGGANGLL